MSNHYGTKAQTRLMSKMRNGYAQYLRDLANVGSRDAVIEYVNTCSVKLDMEAMLGTNLDPETATYLLQTPEETMVQVGKRFGTCHMIAVNLKGTRQLMRTLLREHRMTEVKLRLLDLSDTLSFYKF